MELGALYNTPPYIHGGCMSEAIVYCVRNRAKDNQIAYVGCTEKPLEKRKMKHLQNAARGHILKFYSAIRKYGADAFEWEVISRCDSYWEALEEERKAIEFLKPRYNMTTGGGGIKDYKHTKETKKKMSAAKVGKPAAWLTGPNTEEIRRKLRLAALRREPRVISEDEYKKICVNAALGRLGRRKPVMCITDGKAYPSVAATAKAYDLNIASVTYYCQGRFKNVDGLEFRYVEP